MATMVALLGFALWWVVRALEPRVGALFLRSMLLAITAALMALPLGVPVGALLARTSLPARQVWLFSMLCLLLIPLVLVAAGWDAGFGRLGWWKWIQQGDLRGERWSGLVVAAWVHACAAVPWVVLLTWVGLAAAPEEVEESLQLDSGPWRAVWHASWARWWTLLLALVLWLVVLTFGEMTVTDLYQVRTFAEEVYLDLPQAQNLAGGNAMASGGLPAGWFARPAGLLTMLWVAASAMLVGATLGDDARAFLRSQPARIDLGGYRWLASMFVLLVVLLVAGVPLANLVVRLGIVVRPSPTGGVPSWSAVAAWEQLIGVPGEYPAEMVWTLIIATSATVASAVILTPLAWWVARHDRWRFVFLFAIGACMALPGPVIGTLLIRLFNHDIGPLIFFYDRTVLPPVLAIVIRFGPWFGLLAWIAFRTIPAELLDAARAEGFGTWRQLVWIGLPQSKGVLSFLGMGTWLFAAGEVPASILVLPPGIETLPRLVFGQLHAGVYDQVAALCLFQVCGIGLLAGIILILATYRQRRNTDAT